VSVSVTVTSATVPVRPLVRGPARGLCVGHAVDADRGDEHNRDDQFLYHLGKLLRRSLCVWGLARLITPIGA
jgi:hypothetical protein